MKTMWKNGKIYTVAPSVLLSIVPEVTMSKDVSFTKDISASLVINGIKERGKLTLGKSRFLTFYLLISHSIFGVG